MRASRKSDLEATIGSGLEALAKDQGNRGIYDAVGAFLAEHRLEPTPENYLLAYSLVNRTNAAAVAAIEEATSDGIRLSQRDADRILKDSGISFGEAREPAAAEVDFLNLAQRQLDTVETIVGSTQAHTERYGRDLQTSAAQIRAFCLANPLEDLLRITAQMIERTKEAELQLKSTNEEVKVLRRELASKAEEARTDALTGLANRRALEDRFNRLQESGVIFSAAVCDIDRFKSINDRLGHAVGDRVLKAVARVLETGCPGHMVSRFGGEEFVILLSSMRAPAAAVLIDSARAELAGRRFKVRETDGEIGVISFSAGVVEARAGETWLDLLKRADELLYRAKEGGRNRVEVEEMQGAVR